jgi:HEPN domain-containing protein
MQPSWLREAQDWLERAEGDLDMARRGLIAPVNGAGVVYHAQQAGEKALKAFLAAHGQAFAKTHDLLQLLPGCEGIEPRFAQFRNTARILSPYSEQFRYPTGPLHPTDLEAQRAFQMATDLVAFVQTLLFPPVAPASP